MAMVYVNLGTDGMSDPKPVHPFFAGDHRAAPPDDDPTLTPLEQQRTSSGKTRPPRIAIASADQAVISIGPAGVTLGRSGATPTPGVDTIPPDEGLTKLHAQHVDGRDVFMGHELSDARVAASSDETVTLIDAPPLPIAPNHDPNRTSPERKMVKLHARGTLVSPPPKPPSAKATRVAKTRASKFRKGREQLVIVLRYGQASDGESTSSLSDKVQRILRAQAPQSPRPTPQPIMDIGPPKPTHPFFLGKAKPPTGSQGFETTLTSNLSPATSTGGATSSPAVSAGRVPSPSRTSGPARANPSFLFEQSRVLKYPGTVAPLWPGRQWMHIRGLGPVEEPSADTTEQRLRHSHKKLKNAIVQVPETEDLLKAFASRLRHRSQGWERSSQAAPDGQWRQEPRVLRTPERTVTTGEELQGLVRQELHTPLRSSRNNAAMDEEDQEPVERMSRRINVPEALQRVYDDIRTSRTPFDRAECETQAWVAKYAPKHTSEVLQTGPEVHLLHDWLQRSVVTAVEKAGEGSRPNSGTKRPGLFREDSAKQRAKRRKKRAEDFEDFIVSSDEEGDEMDELAAPEDGESPGLEPFRRTVVRSGDMAPTATAAPRKVTNAVLISGPHGCGKTAAAYAVAKDLNFEVFEMHPGGRRSGKDLLDKVGDLTRNHLVQQAKSEVVDVDLAEAEGSLQRDIDSGKQRVLSAFMTRPTRPASAKSTPPSSAAKAAKDAASKSRNTPKQSVILLEEVDVLFEEDRQFWSTVLALLAQSRRPVIMTCTDESLVPLEELSLHAILRFDAPPEAVTVDYLLLLAANEGHLIHRSAVQALYEATWGDLRACIMELDFWCQMAVGDTKGGLEWMHQHGDEDEERIVSKETYQTGMGWISGEYARGSGSGFRSNETELLHEAWDEWQVDVLDFPRGDKGSKGGLPVLQRYDASLEALSAADVYAGWGTRTSDEAHLDATIPGISERDRMDLVQGTPFLDATPASDYSRLSVDIALTVQTLSQQTCSDAAFQSGSSLEDRITSKIRSRHTPQPFHARDLRHTFRLFQPMSPLSSDPSPSLLATETAPYIRSVIRFDILLEQRRNILSGLLSGTAHDGGTGGHGNGNGIKHIRTTRASRSALEGSERASTRRERWFDWVSATLSALLKTGGDTWGDAAARMTELAGSQEADVTTSQEAGVMRSQETEVTRPQETLEDALP